MQDEQHWGSVSSVEKAVFGLEKNRGSSLFDEKIEMSRVISYELVNANKWKMYLKLEKKLKWKIGGYEWMELLENKQIMCL